MYKEDLALNNLQRLICHKTKQTKTKQKEKRCGNYKQTTNSKNSIHN